MPDIVSYKEIAANFSATACIAWIAFYVVKKVIELGDKYLGKQLESQMTILANHEKERIGWIDALKKFNESLDRFSGYQREEHAKMMQILEGLEKDVRR